MRAAGRSDAGEAACGRPRRTASASDISRGRASPPRPTSCSRGAPAFGVDFIDKAYGAFPWLILAVLVLSYLLLLRAFRSVWLPLKAVVMNLLSVSATYGVLTLAFQHGWGESLGLQSSPQIEAWIPIFLFAMLFGLSMDYEVFLLSRMREEWDAPPRQRARRRLRPGAHGPHHHGAAIIMIAAFSGFTFGSFVGLQEFGLGLSVAILLDATLVRAVLVPAVMKIMGDWNWYLPARVRRVLRVPAAPGARDRIAATPRAPRRRGAGADRRAAGRPPARRRRPSPGCTRAFCQREMLPGRRLRRFSGRPTSSEYLRAAWGRPRSGTSTRPKGWW